jgi:hypothetical protein
MTSLVTTHSAINHGNEVAWALWAHIVLGLPISGDTAKAAKRMNDSIVAILLLDANSKKLIQSPINFDNYKKLMIQPELYGDQWLLSYEANIKKWLPSMGIVDHVSSDKNFGYLKTSSVSFYDDKWTAKNKPQKTTKKWLPSPGDGGGGGGGGIY